MHQKKLLLLLGGLGILTAWACNNQRPANENDSTATAMAPPADSAEMTPGAPDYNKTVTFKQYSFAVNAKGKGTLRRLIINSTDSAGKFAEVNTPLEGSIYYATAADLDNDGRPEVYCFARGADSSGYTKVYAYAVDQKGNKPITFPELTSEDAARYKGYDSIYIEKGYVVRSFPIDGAEAGNAQRKTIRYRLKHDPSAYRLEQVQ